MLVPLPPAAQLQVELTETGVPSAVWVVTANGRFTIAAYAAPKTGGLWREVAGELAESLRNDGATVTIQDGRWGREVVGTATGVVRFIGVDGYRWMIRCVVNGSIETIDALTEEAREALVDTVIRRGDTPLPVRTPLPVQLPEPMASQLREAAAAQGAAGGQAVAQPGPEVASEQGEHADRAPQRLGFGDAAAAQHRRLSRRSGSSSAARQAAPSAAGSAPSWSSVIVRNAARGAAVAHSRPTSSG